MSQEEKPTAEPSKGTFSIGIGGLATEERENELLQALRQLATKFKDEIHVVDWNGSTTGRHFVKDEA